MSLTKTTNSMILGAVINVADYGAIGDGSDETAKLQAAITALPLNGTLIGANGVTYTVTSLLLKSNMFVKSLNLLTLAGSVDFVSPITIDGTIDLKTNIVLEDVIVNGNRQNQTNITAPGYEDGGRHGFRVIGRVSNLYMNRCTATYCGTDGLEIYSNVAIDTSTDLRPCFNNIYITNCQFLWNRRHGIALDSANNVIFTNNLTSFNGRNLDDTAAFNSGLRGASSSAPPTVTLYGNGIDVEGYGLGTRVTNLFFNSCTSLQNIRSGFWFFDISNPTEIGFSPRGNIILDKCVSDPGIGTTEGFPCFYFAGTPEYEPLGFIYQSVVIKNSYASGGGIIARGTNGVVIGANTLDSGVGSVMLFTNSKKVDVSRDNIYLGISPQNIDDGGFLISYVKAIKLNVGQTLPNVTPTLITFDTTISDDAGEWTGTNTFTAKLPGVYSITLTLAAGGISGKTDIFVNYGGVSYATVSSRLFTLDTADQALSGSIQVRLATADTITITGVSNTSTTLITGNPTWSALTIARVR